VITDSKLNYSYFSVFADFFQFGVCLVDDYAPQEEGLLAT
jgi:hypothetical protein